MLLTIGKPGQFQDSGLPVRGQCQPYSHDWQLKLFDKGITTILFEGTYYVCRQLQIECKNDNDINKIKESIDRITKEFLDDTQETAVITDSIPASATDDLTKAETGTIAIDKNEMERIAKKNLTNKNNQ